MSEYIYAKTTELKKETEELKLRDERLKYYGDVDIVPSDETQFTIEIHKINDVEVGTASITSFNHTDEKRSVVVPCRINGYKITKIANSVFTSNDIFSIRFPNTITRIGSGNFDGNMLATIYIPNSVTSITESDFIVLNEKVVCYCAEGSYADIYAKKHEFAVEYTDEVTKQFVLDNGGKSKVITSVLDTLILEDRQDAQLGELSALVLMMHDEIESTYYSSFNFKSGDTATILTYTDTPIIWHGDDCDSDGDFIPEANTTYEISIKNLGTNGIVARVGVV